MGDVNRQEVSMITISKQWFKLVFLMLVTGFIFNCTSGKVQVDLPSTHPAHPRAPEANFNPVANPFADGLSDSIDFSGSNGEQIEKSIHHDKMGGHHGHSMKPGEEKHPVDMHKENHHQKPRGGPTDD